MRVWCDGTYGPFLWETLLEIARASKAAEPWDSAGCFRTDRKLMFLRR